MEATMDSKKRALLASLAIAAALPAAGCGGSSDPEQDPYAAPVQTIPGGPGTPAIAFTSVPSRGSRADLHGQVLHVHPREFNVAVYIYVSGWWTKPYFAQPLTAIRADGSWTADITTGGIDELATAIAAYLVPGGYQPPLLGGASALPASLETNAAAKVVVSR
jgi:hypothetical protein